MPTPPLTRFRHQPHILPSGARGAATLSVGSPSRFYPSVAPVLYGRSGFAKLKDQHRAGLRNHRFDPLNFVDPVLNALGIQSPTSRDGYVLLAIDFKGRGNTNHPGGRWKAPELIPRSRIEGPELSVGRSTREYQVPAGDQERRPEDGLKVVLPDPLARIQIPGLKFAKVIGCTCGNANRSKDAFYLVANIEPDSVGLRHVSLWEKCADVVVRRNVQELRLWAPCFRNPVLSTTDARTEFGVLRGTRALRLINGGSPRLRVNRCEHVVVRKREGVKEVKLSLSAIQN